MLPGKVHRIGSTRYTVKLYVPGMHEPKAGTNTHAKTTMRSCCTCGSYLLERDYPKQNQSSSVAEDNRQDRQMIESVMMMMAMTPKLAAVVVSLVPGSSCSHAGSHELLLDLTVLYGH